MKKGQMVAWCAADNSAASFVSAHKLMLIRRSCVQNKSIPHCKIYGITLPSHLPTWPNISQSTRTYPAQEMKIIRNVLSCSKRNARNETSRLKTNRNGIQWKSEQETVPLPSMDFIQVSSKNSKQGWDAEAEEVFCSSLIPITCCAGSALFLGA